MILKTPSVAIPTQLSADPEVSERSPSHFHQVEHPLVSDGGFQDRNSSSREQISADESSDHTDYDDIDYVPDSVDSCSDTSVCSRKLTLEETPSSPKATTTHMGINSLEKPTSCVSSSRSSSLSTSLTSCSTSSSRNTSDSNNAIKITPLPSTAKQSKYNKKQYCLYCKKAISKLARHLESVHSTQPDVARAFSFNKKSHERRDLLRSIKKRGNFNHNAAVASSGAGEMVACRRPSSARQSDDFRHCKFCQGLYARGCLWRHVRNCLQKPVVGQSTAGRKRIQLDLPRPNNVHEAVWKIACEMNEDDISLVVRSERNILSLGESLYNARKPHEQRNDYIRQKMREMARLLITARAITPLKSTEDLVMPSNFPHVIQAVRAVAGYDLESNSYKIPSLALKLGHSLGKVAGIVQCSAIIANRHAVAESAKQFATLHQKKWAESISAAALGTLQQAKWNKPQVLPFTQDVSLLHKFLATECAKYIKDLEEKPSSISFGNLAQVTLTQVVLFNRKRQGEVSKMELQIFTSRSRSELNPDIMKCLTELERTLAKHFDRVEIRGKRSRMVPVLLTPDMIAAMNLLVKSRNKCQVHTDNIYLFARPGVLSYYRGSDCFRRYANECGAKYPEALTSTRLRKQVATLSTVLNLKENEMDQLANFLGHDIRVHREFYRLPESTLQLAKVSKLLMVMEKGKLSGLKGKGLDEIEIHPDDEIMSDNDSSEENITGLHQHKGSRTKTSEDSTTLDNMEATSASTIPDFMEGTSVSTTPDFMEGTSASTTPDFMEGTSASTTPGFMEGTSASTTLDSMESISQASVSKSRQKQGTNGGYREEPVDHRLTDREWADEWRHLDHVLNCIVDMVEKTRRSVSVLRRCQESDREELNYWRRRSSEQEDPRKGGSGSAPFSKTHSPHSSESDSQRDFAPRPGSAYVTDEIWRKAEEAVNEVKRQAMDEVQKAVAEAEQKAFEMIATERAKMEKTLAEAKRKAQEDAIMVINEQEDSSECCWNCGRKASETCSGCNAARYCGSFCQHKDWERHHLICSPGLQAQPKPVSAITASRAAAVAAAAAAAAGVSPVGLAGVKASDSVSSVSSPGGEKALVASRSSTPSTPASAPETNGH